MFEDILLVHKPLQGSAKTALKETRATPFAGVDEKSWVLWKTCLRHIAIGTATLRVCPLFVRKTDKIYTGQAAYQFFLEIISGLHSPIVGETEVMGQVKELALNLGELVRDGKASATEALVYKFLTSAISDTKIVREKCLRNLGNRSYGSLLRKYIAGSESLHLVGAGKLIKEILPWLINKTPSTTVYCRRVAQGQELKREFSEIQVEAWNPGRNESLQESAWVIAAPIEAREINHFFKTQNSIKVVVDLRDDSDTDPIKVKNVQVLKLKEFFNQIEGAQLEVDTKAKQARELIANLVLKRLQAVEIRPFGWEDLCG